MPKKKAIEEKATPVVAEYLSYSSINTMVTDPKKWFQEKIMKIRDDEFNTYFARGNAVHSVIEHYNKT
jgi:hypothetical protein